MILGLPSALWFLLLLLPLAGLFFYRHRSVVVTVPSIVLWESSLRQVSGSPFGRRFRRVASFLVQAAILAALVLALADPRFGHAHQNDVAIIVDCSATMQTRELSGETRLQEAIRTAQAIADEAPKTSLVTVTRAGMFPEVVLRNETDKARIRSALGGLAADDVDADLADAVRFAESMRTQGRPQQIVCVSDFCAAEPSELPKPNADLILHQVGSDQPNLGITDLRFASGGRELVVRIGRRGAAPKEATVRLVVNDQEAARGQAGLEDRTTEVRLPAAMKPGDVFSVSLEPPDALPLDNIAWGVCPVTDDVKVRLVSEGNVFLEKAIRANPPAQLQRVSPAQWTHDDKADVTILDGSSVIGLDAFHGRFIVVSPQAETLPTAAATMPAGNLTYWRSNHPVLQNADPTMWGTVRGASPPRLPNSRVLVAAGERPILYEWPDAPVTTTQPQPDVARTKIVVLNFDLVHSDLPLRPAFPVLLWDTIDYLLGWDRLAGLIARPTGSPMTAPAAPRSETVTVVRPDGQHGIAVRTGDKLVWQRTEKQGIYTFVSGRDTRRVAANWMSALSSSPLNAIIPPSTPQGKRATIWPALPWQRLVLAVIILGLLEWLLYRMGWLRMD